ncbi:DUF262 domain-containing protein [Algoriphagus mannitolivorans]|uniref:DUF262 domain-containing protein n=1 Tax=Algoriphagus mannitolivorans TaxID=226504 RepID=UPI0003FFA900|nr:DUF262 domain-containing protein [Algoriphagus mannitolivorans]
MKEWFDKIERSEIRLPRFQRPEAWDKGRVKSLMNTIIHNLPLGITLLLDVEKSDEPFVSRPLETAPDLENKVNEHLLDGQQRLTAFWRALHNNYQWETYFVYNSQFDQTLSNPEGKEFTHYFEVICQPRWFKEGSKRPLWADDPKESLNRGYIPLDLFSPKDISDKIEIWVKSAISHEFPSPDDPNAFKKLTDWNAKKDEIIVFIRDKREIIKHYNLPYLSLPLSTPKDTALQVFINMNTNSKPLSQYDIIRAEIEGVKGVSLDEYEKHLNAKFPSVKHYFELSYLILSTSALLQDKLPNQRGMWDMKKDKMIENWDTMEKGLGKMADFLERQGVYDQGRLPTNAVLAVIATLYSYIPETLDARGKFELLLKKYLWSSFFTDRYENSAATHAYSDFTFLKNIITGAKKENGELYSELDVPVLNRQKYQIETREELLQVGWPKRENIRARAIMAVFSKLGALDFADGTPLTRAQLVEGKRHYHHVFPDDLLKETEMESYVALNCSLITDKTNLSISNKEPYSYLKERYSWTTESEVNSRLISHLIPIAELKKGGYAGLNAEERKEKIKADYSNFLSKRAEYVHCAVLKLVEGKEISANEIIAEVDNLTAI